MSAPTPAPSLSPREIEVLRHLAQGLTYDSIARRLKLSPHTVETYLRRIRAKTGSANRTQLALLTVTLPPPSGAPPGRTPSSLAARAQHSQGDLATPPPQARPGERELPAPPGRPPDPASATTPGEFVQQLRLLRAWCGEPSLRQLEKQTGLPRSTLAQALDVRRNRLPPLERVVTIVKACGLSARGVDHWKDCWRRVCMQLSALPPD